jgi:adenosylhomocysteine nucleosidase
MDRPGRVGLLAPMTHELAPLVRRFGLEARATSPPGCLEATVDGVGFVATMTGIGMQAGADAARRVLDAGVEHVAVVGIAGGIDPALEIGALVVPESVLHAGTGRHHVPARIGDVEPRGIIRSSDEFLTDDDAFAALVATGVVALDMETGSVAEVCDARGVPWSVFRAVSDRPADKLVDAAVWAMTGPDGGADPDALRRYLDADPGAGDRLARMAADMELAVRVAADAAFAAFTVRLPRQG